MKTYLRAFGIVLLWAIVLGSIALLSGCNWIPRGLRIGGSPIDRVAKRQAEEMGKRNEVLERARRDVHQTQDALASAPDSPAVAVAKDFNAEAAGLLDQAQGPALVGDLQAWQDQVSKLLSVDPTVKMKAELARANDREEIGKLSSQLADKQTAINKAESKALAYAKDSEGKANVVRWLFIVVFAVSGVWILSQGLTIAARFFPATAPFAALFNSVAAPAVHFAFSRAQTGLVKIGHAITAMRTQAPDIAERAVSFIDSKVDPDHVRIIAAAASTAPRAAA